MLLFSAGSLAIVSAFIILIPSYSSANTLAKILAQYSNCLVHFEVTSSFGFFRDLQEIQKLNLPLPVTIFNGSLAPSSNSSNGWYNLSRHADPCQSIFIHASTIQATLQTVEKLQIRTYLETTEIFAFVASAENTIAYASLIGVASITLITQKNNMTFWNSYCPLCYPNKPSFEFKNTVMTFLKSGKTNQANGHGAALVSGVGHLMPPECLSDVQAYFSFKHSQCGDYMAIFNIISNRLNYSRRIGPISKSKQELTICIDCQLYPESLLSKTMPIQFYMKASFMRYLYYCEFQANYVTASWGFLLQAYDMASWLAIVGTALALSLYHRNLEYGFDVLTTFVLQACIKKWSRLLTTAMFVFLVLGYAYQGIITSLVLAPLPEAGISRISTLFTSGHKFLVPNADALKYILQAQTRNLERAKCPKPYDNYFKVEPNFSLDGVKDPAMLAEKQGITVWTPMPRTFEIYKVGNVTCHVLFDDPISFETLIWTMESTLSLEFYSAIQKLTSAGIVNFWADYTLKAAVHSLLKRIDNSFKPQATTFYNSSVKIVFFLYLILVFLCILVWLIEIVWAQYLYRIFRF